MRPVGANDPLPMLRVMVLANVRLYRDGISHALGNVPGLEVVGTAAVNPEGVDLLADVHPDIVLLEAASCNSMVIEAIELADSRTRVVAYAISDEESDALRCAEAGAAGYVSEDADVEALCATVVRVANGEFPCTPRVAALLARRVSALSSARQPEDVAAVLTQREREIVRLVDAGLSNKEIGARLGIELSTVKNHVHHILGKTRASRRSQAAARVRAPWTARASLPPESLRRR